MCDGERWMVGEIRMERGIRLANCRLRSPHTAIFSFTLFHCRGGGREGTLIARWPLSAIIVRPSLPPTPPAILSVPRDGEARARLCVLQCEAVGPNASVIH